ncbi:unnamed protein product [Clavelina lepadiformis]|uniref:Claudin n=1 Tax=Clavelina lepadiformis TaxID=159417 RepID=A0ABP0H6M9_CLALP
MYQQFAALGIAFLTTASIATTTFWNQWSVNGPTSDGLLGPIWAWRSLWGDCIQYQGGQYQCQGQNSMFLTPGFKIAIRGLMITSICLSVSGCFLILLGMQCTRIFENNAAMKRKLMFISGLFYAIAGIFTFISVSWFTWKIYNEFFSFENQAGMFKWELGAAVYLGFVSSVFSALAFLACVCMPGPRDDGPTTPYKYQPGKFNITTLPSQLNYTHKSMLEKKPSETPSDTYRRTQYV